MTDIQTTLRSWLGHRLEGVYAGIRYHDCTFAYDDPDSLWLKFQDLSAYRIRLASDGWNLSIDSQAPAPYDIGQYGEGIIVDFCLHSVFSFVREQLLRQVVILCSPGKTDCFGINLYFETESIAIMNWGDTFRLERNFSQTVDDSGKAIEARIVAAILPQ